MGGTEVRKKRLPIQSEHLAPLFFVFFGGGTPGPLDGLFRNAARSKHAAAVAKLLLYCIVVMVGTINTVIYTILTLAVKRQNPLRMIIS